MAQIILQTFKETLFILPENHEEFLYLPSPHELKRRILVKTKVPILGVSSKDLETSTQNLQASVFKKNNQKLNELLNQKLNTPLQTCEEIIKKNNLKNEDFNVRISEDNSYEYIQQKNKNIEFAELSGCLGFGFESSFVKSVCTVKRQIKEEFLGKKTRRITEILEEQTDENIDETMQPKSTLVQEFLNRNNIFISKNQGSSEAMSNSLKVAINDEQRRKNEKFEENEELAMKIVPDNSTSKKLENLTQNSVFSRVNSGSPSMVDFHKITANFSKCVSLIGIKLKFDDEKRSVFSISSMNESRISKFFYEEEHKIIDFHRKFLSRVYPSGKRIDSSNYDPISSFLSGCQMIALNIQTADIFLLIYNSIFQENGGVNSGYVLKPKFLQHAVMNQKKNYPSAMLKIKKNINISILSGQKISGFTKKSHNSYYLEIVLKGSKQDEVLNKVFRSEILKKSWFNLKFNLKAEFSIRCPEVCFIIFQIFGKNEVMADEKLAWYCVPVSKIRQGYRIVPLMNNEMRNMENSFLFAKVKISK